MSPERVKILMDRIARHHAWLLAELLTDFHTGMLPGFELNNRLSAYLKDEEKLLSEKERNWMQVEEFRKRNERNPEFEDEDEHASNPGVA